MLYLFLLISFYLYQLFLYCFISYFQQHCSYIWYCLNFFSLLWRVQQVQSTIHAIICKKQWGSNSTLRVSWCQHLILEGIVCLIRNPGNGYLPLITVNGKILLAEFFFLFKVVQAGFHTGVMEIFFRIRPIFPTEVKALSSICSLYILFKLVFIWEHDSCSNL